MATKGPDPYQELEETLACPLCLERCNNPKSLTCLHIYCLNCLDQLIQTSGQGGSIQCPSCRTQVQVPQGGAQNFPNSFFWNSLGESVDKLKSLGLHQTPECSLCSQDGKHTSAVKLCTDCMSTLCHECLKYHSRIASSHKMFDCSKITPEDLNEILRNKTEKCKEHGKDIELYCETCAELVCMMCAMVGHASHTKQEVTKVVDAHKKELEALKDSLTCRVQHYECSLAKIDTTQKNCIAEAHKIVQTVENHGEKIIEQVREVIRKFNTVIESENEKSVKHLQSLHKKLLLELSQLKSCLKQIDITLKNANTSTLISTVINEKQFYQTILQDLPNHNLPKMTFDLNLVDLSTLKQLSQEYLIGTVQCKTHNEPLRESGATPKPVSVSAGQTQGAVTKVKKTAKVTVDVSQTGRVGIKECATDGSYITLEYRQGSGYQDRISLDDWRMTRTIDGEEAVTFTLQDCYLLPGKTMVLCARGEKPPGHRRGKNKRHLECAVPTWGTGDNIVTTLYGWSGAEMAKHTQTTSVHMMQTNLARYYAKTYLKDC